MYRLLTPFLQGCDYEERGRQSRQDPFSKTQNQKKKKKSREGNQLPEILL